MLTDYVLNMSISVDLQSFKVSLGGNFICNVKRWKTANLNDQQVKMILVKVLESIYPIIAERCLSACLYFCLYTRGSDVLGISIKILSLPGPFNTWYIQY